MEFSDRSQDRSNKKPCFAFRDHGTCKFGTRCNFSHSTQNDPSQEFRSYSAHNGRNSYHTRRQSEPQQAKLREWKQLLNRPWQYSRPSTETVGRFFQLGLDLMKEDLSSSHEAIRLLISEEGLAFIKEVTDRHILLVKQEETRKILWNVEVKPLFQLATHPRVADSAVLEQEVSALFNFLLGVSGSRMTRLFDYIIGLAGISLTYAEDISRVELVQLSLAVLSKLLDCNTTNIVNVSFSTIATDLSKFLDVGYYPGEELLFSHASKSLQYIKQRIEVGEAILPFDIFIEDKPVHKESFILVKDLPGQLSANGPRHDNDHGNMTDINILPTYEEISSVRQEYLPTNDCLQWHVPGIRGRLDREFRLVREDTVGQLRDAVREVLEHIRNPDKTAMFQSKNGLRTYTYDCATLANVEIGRYGGLEFMVRCAQPKQARIMSRKHRKDWWLQSKRLQVGALLCMIYANELLFCVVSNSTMRSKDDKPLYRADQRAEATIDFEDKEKAFTLSDDQDFLYVKLQAIESTELEISHILQWYHKKRPSSTGYLVEFPGVLLDSFKHTLVALQEMYRKPEIPFTELLAPPRGAELDLEIEPPLYARKAGFVFNLQCISNHGEIFEVSPLSPPDPHEVALKTSLDLTQSAALLNALSEELSLIQGPPGTGKSYTGEKIVKVLLGNKTEANIGPILCVCYTNHALDQLLEHLLDDGVGGIIRMGSRSKSDRLQDLNLRAVAKSTDRTRLEKSSIYHLEQTINLTLTECRASLHELSNSDSWPAVKNLLKYTSPMHHRELFGDIEEGWEKVKNNSEDNVRSWLNGGSRKETRCRSLDVLEQSKLSTMNHAERCTLYRQWQKEIRDPPKKKFLKSYQKYTEAKEQRDRVRGDVDLRCLQQANIVGVTTTGLARNLHLLRRLGAKVLLCEEAGEVLEAHLLTALLPSIEHAILIGDHLQLRPQIQNYDLQSTNPRGKQYSLDISLFERLVRPTRPTDFRLPFSTLETQRRMHPSIAELIRSTLYPDLQDDQRVRNYPPVLGMRKRLFWMHHEHIEASDANGDPLATSHSNDFEIEMTVALVSHLVRQGESSQGDIAVLTPYLGQLHKLRRRMESMFEICLNDRDLEDLDAALNTEASETPQLQKTLIRKGALLKTVRIATVDNFQGEEAKIIIISLVRSNLQNRCGFLSTSNRINVLLSRAKHGMYIIGNSNTCRNVRMWADIISLLKETDCYGSSLELQCPRHSDQRPRVSQPDHFLLFSPESGCNQACEKRLRCGHSCIGRCHSDVLHDAVKCLEDCPRSKKGCDHSCPLRCGEPCQPRCEIFLETINLVLPCGHSLLSARCWEVQKPELVLCKAKVVRAVPGCNHQVTVLCHEDVAAARYRCPAKCGHHRPCGHTCNRSCSTCNKRKEGKIVSQDHALCSQRCGRKSTTCPHSCSKMCHDGEDCPPCGAACEVRCSHSKCSKPCHEPCAPCAEEKCQSSCPHTQCSMPCAVPCDWVPCSKRCEKALGCGHQCPSLCGEQCPDISFCQTCGSDEIKSVCVDFLEMKTYEEIDLDEDPCIFPDCGHFLTVSSMDGQMDMAAHYVLDENSIPQQISRHGETLTMDSSDTKVCANCRGSLRNVARYGRIIRGAMLYEATKKFIAWSNLQYLSLAEHLLSEQEKLDRSPIPKPKTTASRNGNSVLTNTRLKELCSMRDLVGGQRYDSIITLFKSIRSYVNNVKKEEQPFQRVADLVRHANRRDLTTKEFRFDHSAIQVKGFLLASTLMMKCEMMIVTDFLALNNGKETTSITVDLPSRWAECVQIIELARSAKHPKEEIQGRIFSAQLCGLFLLNSSCVAPNALAAIGNANTIFHSTDVTKDLGLQDLEKARALFEKSPSLSNNHTLKNEIDAVEMLLNGGIYRPVTAEEMRAVYSAMRSEMSGTGHWYVCVNGHPFTVGECGMPMEQTRCPDCGSPIGGSNHASVEGVRYADEIEQLARNTERMRV